MTLLDMEGYDDQTVLVASSGWAWPQPTVPTYITGRHGGFALQHGNAYGQLPITASATAIVGMAVQVDTLSAAFAYRMPQFFTDSGATGHIYATIEGGFAALYNGAGTRLALATTQSVPINTWFYIELRGTIADAGGRGIVRVNGVTVIDFTGDTRNGGTSTNIDSIRVGVFNQNNTFRVDDLYVCDALGSSANDFLGDCRVQTLYPNGNGVSSQWVGSDGNSTDNYLLVDEAGAPSAVDYVGSATVGNRDSYTFGDLTGTPTVHAVKVSAHANNSDAGTGSVQLATRSAAANYDSSAKTLVSAVGVVSDLRVTDPATSAAWTATAVNAAEFGVVVA